jgi:hypothetical protein
LTCKREGSAFPQEDVAALTAFVAVAVFCSAGCVSVGRDSIGDSVSVEAGVSVAIADSVTGSFVDRVAASEPLVAVGGGAEGRGVIAGLVLAERTHAASIRVSRTAAPH